MSLYEWLEAARRKLGERTSRVLVTLFKVVVTSAVAVGVLGFLGMQFTTSPRFCVMCHYMKPYYESWKHSSHRDVRCVECHFPPGIHSELAKKFEALNQVTKYVTRQYGTRPWTQIDDASCLRSGCHQTRLLKGKVEFKGVEFDHVPHLTRFRRVTRLRCTSCHSQLVQGEHMTVTESACFQCHLKPDDGQEELSSCTICHDLSRAPDKGKMDHRFVLERGVACQECHAHAVYGDGAVPQERCLLCHSEKERLAKYDDVAFMHENHVTERKIECSQCHNPIEHRYDRPGSARAESGPHGERNAASCATCHQSQHDAVQLLYAGKGGQGVEVAPDPMYRAGVTCEACHRTLPGTSADKAVPGGAAGCMMCHGEEYGKYLAAWNAEFGAPVEGLRRQLLKAERLVARMPEGSGRRREARSLMDKALANARLVTAAGGLHNPRFSRALLAAAAAQANEALRMAGAGYRIPVAAAQATPSESVCARCHEQIPSGSWTIFGAQFSHRRHATAPGLVCTECHRDGSPEDALHGQVRLDAASCRTCHQKRLRSPHGSGWLGQHGARAQQPGRSCEICHSSSQCAQCHGLTMPHQRTWRGQHGKEAEKRQWACRRCHAQSQCTACHGIQMPHPENFALEHASVASFDKDSLCFRCHDRTKTCAECHGD